MAEGLTGIFEAKGGGPGIPYNKNNGYISIFRRGGGESVYRRDGERGGGTYKCVRGRGGGGRMSLHSP